MRQKIYEPLISQEIFLRSGTHVLVVLRMIGEFVYNRILSVGVGRNPEQFSLILERITVIVTDIHSARMGRGGESTSLEAHHGRAIPR